MTIQAWIIMESGTTVEGHAASSERKYAIKSDDGTAVDRLQARDKLDLEAPLIDDGLFRQTYTVEPVSDDLWYGTVTYNTLPPPLQVGESSYTFETAGGTEHIERSLATVNVYTEAGVTAPTPTGLIGDDGKGNVEGCDIVSPVFRWTETHIIEDTTADQAWFDTLEDLTGTVNMNTWRGRAPGRILFLGATGNKRGDDEWEMTFSFASGRNITGLTIGNITGIDKKAWEYLWVRREIVEDANGQMLMQTPKAVFIEQVYEYRNFLLLQIGS